MDFIDQIRALSVKIQKLQDSIGTEEAAKNAFVLPFINALGYDVFDPTEVIPEFTADVGTKKGEKVDFAIIKDSKPIILIECKPCGAKLDVEHASQLYRYFSVTEARIGILTDGIRYRFFTDLEAANKMDEKPFMEFNMLDIQEQFVAEIKKLGKSTFDIQLMISTATELKYTKEIKRILGEQLQNPSPEFVKIFSSQVYSGKMMSTVVERFTEISKRAFGEFINDRINERLRSAMMGYSVPTQNDEQPVPLETTVVVDDSKILTTQEELEGYHIIKAILREDVDVNRISIRDQQSYCGILLDDNNRKPLARLYFNRSEKKLGLFNENRQEEKSTIANLNEIYAMADKLKAGLMAYEVKV